MTTSEKLTAIAENQQKVYDAGYEKGKAEGGGDTGNAAFWDFYQDNGNRTDYRNAFAGYGWTVDVFKPRHNIAPTDAYMMFRDTGMSGDLVEILNELGVTLDFSNCTRPQYSFSGTNFTRLGVLDFSKAKNGANSSYLFTWSPNLVAIDGLHFNPNITDFSSGHNLFVSCPKLANIGYTAVDENGNEIIGGVSGIASNNISFTSCPLTAHSLRNILNGLVDYSQDTSGTSWVLTLGASNLAKLSDADKAVASQKGWTLA